VRSIFRALEGVRNTGEAMERIRIENISTTQMIFSRKISLRVRRLTLTPAFAKESDIVDLSTRFTRYLHHLTLQPAL